MPVLQLTVRKQLICKWWASVLFSWTNVIWHCLKGLNEASWKGHCKTEVVSIILRAIRLFILVREAEHNGNCQDQYNCSCQDTEKFASHSGQTRIMPKPIVLPSLHAPFTAKKTIQRNTKQPEHFTAWGSALVSQELKGALCLWNHGPEQFRLHASQREKQSSISPSYIYNRDLPIRYTGSAVAQMLWK